jgi:hypothetical protein
MNLIYAPEKIDVTDWHSVFLAGPTPRDPSVASWRPKAIQLFSDMKFNGSLYIPEPRNGGFDQDDEARSEWEHLGIANAGAVLFWVPRDIAGGMPGFTTNVEFGWVVRMVYEEGHPDRVFYGRPDHAEECKYLDWLYHRYAEKEPHSDLESMVRCVVDWL